MAILAIERAGSLVVKGGRQPGCSAMTGRALPCVVVCRAIFKMTALAIDRANGKMVKCGWQPGAGGMAQSALTLKVRCRPVGQMTIQTLVGGTGVIPLGMAGLTGNFCMPAG